MLCIFFFRIFGFMEGRDENPHSPTLNTLSKVVLTEIFSLCFFLLQLKESIAPTPPNCKSPYPEKLMPSVLFVWPWVLLYPLLARNCFWQGKSEEEFGLLCLNALFCHGSQACSIHHRFGHSTCDTTVIHINDNTSRTSPPYQPLH